MKNLTDMRDAFLAAVRSLDAEEMLEFALLVQMGWRDAFIHSNNAKAWHRMHAKISPFSAALFAEWKKGQKAFEEAQG